MYQLSPDLWTPQARGVQGVLDQWDQGQRPILYSPTGGGKTRQAIELFKWAAYHGLRGVFYVNRRLLIAQTSQAFDRAGIVHGVRAAECEDQYDPTAPFQIASADTEASRVINKGWWTLHAADVVVVDEAHLQRTKAMQWILKQYEAAGAKIVLLTATPIDMEAWATSLVVSGRLQEYRDAKALVVAECKGVSLVDLDKVSRNASGEFVMDGRKKKIYTQTIVGDVIDYWKRFNPDGRPAMAYWPGKAESVWGTQQFEKIGVRWAHVDATDAYLDGERYKLTHSVWQDIMAQYKDGAIKGISSRFKCLDMQTEVLTDKGWRKYGDITLNDQVYQVNMQTGETAIEKPIAIVSSSHSGVMYSIKNASMDVRVTDDHGMVVRSASGCSRWHDQTASEAASRKGAFHVPVAVRFTHRGVDLSDDQLRFIGWFLTDGHLRKDTGACVISQSTSQPAHIHQHIISAIDGCGMKYTTGTYDARIGDKTYAPFVQYRVSKTELLRCGLSMYMDKDMHLNLLHCTESQLSALMEAVFYGDGCKRKNPTYKEKTWCIAKGNETFLGRLQAACVTNGWRANVHVAKCGRLYYTPGRAHAIIRGASDNSGRCRMEPENVDNERVWCVTTRLGTIITRRNGKVVVVKNCREGIDLPTTYHVILATPIGSLASYIQTVGRALRYSPETPDYVLVTDHGGAYHSHGSPNHDRDWHTLWRLSGHAASTLHRSQIKEGKKAESIVCPKCMTERPFGDTCPSCNHKASKSKRRVVMATGEIVEHEGRMIRKQARQTRHNTDKLWARLYWGWKRKHPDKSFRQLEGWFVRKHGYRPSRDLPLMPVHDIDWFAKLRDVPMSQLTGGGNVK